MTEQTQIYPLEEKFRPVTIDTDDAIEFLNEINIYNDRYSGGEWIFRGQNNANWTLLPSIFRDNQILQTAEKFLDEHLEHRRSESQDPTLSEINTRGDAYKFILARVCAAVEHDQVNSFIIGLDNAGIEIPHNSDFHRYNPDPDLRDIVPEGIRIAPRSNFDPEFLKFEIYRLIRSYRQLRHPNDVSKSSWAQSWYSRIEQRYLDISFALAQHSGLPTGLLDWTTNPLVAAFYAAFSRERSDHEYDRLVVWAADSWFIERRQVQARFIKHPRSYIRNIHAQSAVFTRDADDWLWHVCYKRRPFFEKFLMSYVSDNSDRHGAYRITLPFDKRHDLLRLLRKNNVSLSTLEPTHYHVANEVRQDFRGKLQS